MSSTPGWYPDPAGSPGRFRYWNGQSWSSETTSNPAQPRPEGPPGPTPSEESSRPRRGLLIGIVAGILVVVLAAVLGLRTLLDSGDPTAGPPPPSSSVSAWDETSQPTTTPTPTVSDPPPEQVDCPTGDPGVRDDHPDDGRVHGGGLSFPEVEDWGDDQATGLSWAYDVAGQADVVHARGWFALFAVGALRMADGFEQPQASAEMISQCLSSSGYYSRVTDVTELEAGEVTVDGHPGWRIRAEIRVDEPEIDLEGDVINVIVVDTGGGESLGMFVGAVPIDDEDRLAVLDQTEADLTVD